MNRVVVHLAVVVDMLYGFVAVLHIPVRHKGANVGVNPHLVLVKVKAGHTDQRHMRHMGDRLHLAADGDIRRIRRETDTTAGSVDVQTVNTGIGRFGNVLRQTAEHRLIFVVI